MDASSPLDSLSASDQQLLWKVPALVVVLLAGADDEIEGKEVRWAEKLVKYRQHTSDAVLHSYYDIVHEHHALLMQNYLTACGDVDAATRLAFLKPELEKVSAVLKQLPAEFARTLLLSWRSLAKKVADTSGGFLGFGKIWKEEKALIDLPMIAFEA